jgi:hypothetical protein
LLVNYFLRKPKFIYFERKQSENLKLIFKVFNKL